VVRGYISKKSKVRFKEMNVKIELDANVSKAIEAAVLYAISLVGIEGLRATSMFPSANRAPVEFRKAA